MRSTILGDLPTASTPWTGIRRGGIRRFVRGEHARACTGRLTVSIAVGAGLILAGCASRAADEMSRAPDSTVPPSASSQETPDITADLAIAQPIPAERVLFGSLAELAAASSDVVVATVVHIGAPGAVTLPDGTTTDGIAAPTVTYAVEQNLKGTATAIRALDPTEDGRTPVREGQRLLLFLGALDQRTDDLTHGVIDHLVIGDDGVLHSEPVGVDTMTPEQVRGSGGAAFLDGYTMAEVTTALANG